MRYFFLLFLFTGCVAAKQNTIIADYNIHWPASSENPRIVLIDIIPKEGKLDSGKNIFHYIADYFLGDSNEAKLFPFCIQSSTDGKVFVVDSTNNAIHVFDNKNNEHYTFARGGDFFGTPIDIALDNVSGNVYVSDSKAGGPVSSAVRPA